MVAVKRAARTSARYWYFVVLLLLFGRPITTLGVVSFAVGITLAEFLFASAANYAMFWRRRDQAKKKVRP